MSVTLENLPPSQRMSIPLSGGYLNVEVEHDGSEFIVYDESSMFGEGDTLDEAISDLVESLRDVHRDLQALSARLDPRMQAERDRLASLFGAAP